MKTPVANIILLIVLLATIVATASITRSCSKIDSTPSVIERTIIDSVAVQSLRTEIMEMKNKLGKMPKVITVTITNTDTVSVVDTVLVHPVGSDKISRKYPFNMEVATDSLSLNVNADLMYVVYADSSGKMYYEDDLSVWLSDISLKRDIPVKTVRGNFFYLLAGASMFEDADNGYTKRAYPYIGAGYTGRVLGGYGSIGYNSFGVGITLNPIELFRKK